MPSENLPYLGANGLKIVEWEGTAPRGVVTLCGSTKFHDDFISETRRLTLEGYIVISVGLFGHDINQLREQHYSHVEWPEGGVARCHLHEIGFAGTVEDIQAGIDQHLGEGFDFGTDEEPSDLKVLLDEIHLRKIDLADRVHVINPGGYVGLSAAREIAYAMKNSLAITWMVEMSEQDVQEVLEKAGA